MFTVLSNGVAIVPKAYTIKADNVLIAESDKLYFVIPLRSLTGEVYSSRWNKFRQWNLESGWLHQPSG